jgi:hypothetical protein
MRRKSVTQLNVKPAVGFKLPWAGVTPAPTNKRRCGAAPLLELVSRTLVFSFYCLERPLRPPNTSPVTFTGEAAGRIAAGR